MKCIDCSNSIEDGVRKCPHCGSYQRKGLRIWFTFAPILLSLTATILSLLAFLFIPINKLLPKHSHTTVVDTQVLGPGISVIARNTGQASSYIKEAVLEFEGLPANRIEAFPMVVASGYTRILDPQSYTEIRFDVRESWLLKKCLGDFWEEISACTANFYVVIGEYKETPSTNLVFTQKGSEFALIHAFRK